jgi:uncharacterized YigZ family protein
MSGPVSTAESKNVNDQHDKMASYLTLSGSAGVELKVQRSRFLASVQPAADEAQARQIIDEHRRRYHDSRHVCYAWRLGQPTPQENRSDAGEPSGTAGEPILNVLRKAELVDVVAIVVRYFGGIKLGTGGLGRAYRDAAEAAVAQAPVKRIDIGEEFALDFPYNLRKTIAKLLAEAGGRVIAEDYGATIVWRIWLGVNQVEPFAGSLKSATNDQIQMRAST